MKARLFFTPLACLLSALILYLAISDIGKAHRLSGKPSTLTGRLALAKRQVAHDRREFAAVRALHGWVLSPLPFAAVVHAAMLARDVAYVVKLKRQLWEQSWLVRAFLCIHRNPRTGTGEGPWNANTGNGYYGGLQMDWSFMATYGPELLRRKGTADHWTPAEQIAVAIRAYRSGRGFYPWPNTARYCGLI